MRLRVLLFTLLIVFFVQFLKADTWALPGEKSYYSDNELYCFEVTPATVRLTLGEDAECIGTLYGLGRPLNEYSEEEEVFELLLWEVKLVNEISPVSALVTDDGKYVITFNDWGRLGYGDNVIVIYDSTGVVAKKFSLEDILSEDELLLIPHTVSSIWWGGDHFIDNIHNNLMLQVVKNNKMPNDEDVEFNVIWIELETFGILWRDGYRITE